MAPDYQKTKQVAYNIIANTNKVSFPINIKQIIKTHNLKLKTYSTSKNKELMQISEEGFLTRHYNGMYLIAYNSSMPENRKRWTLAHELGHYVLKHTEDPNYNNENYENYDVYEKEANFFAKCLLSPPILFFQIFNHIKKVDDCAVSKVFGISQEAATYLIKYCNEYSQYIAWDIERYSNIVNSCGEGLKQACTLIV